MFIREMLLGVGVAAVTFSAAASQPSSDEGALSGDAARGETLYAAKCGGCHSLDMNRIGPSHRGVVGRKAGSAPKFAYSPALKASKVVWTEETLDLWLQNPMAMIKGTRMGFRMASGQDRADVIAYLKSVSPD